MADQLEVVHLLNKNSKGGAESIVNELTLNNLHENKYWHRKIFISESKLSLWLFKKRAVRYFPIIWASVKLFFLILKNLILRRKIFIFFHLAEGHLVARILSKFAFHSKLIVFVIYLHQSRHLYPQRLIKPTEYLVARYPVICYSKCATDDWFDQKEKINFSRYTLHNFVANEFLINKPTNSSNSNSQIKLIFVGRIAFWKRPDLAIQFANKLSTKSSVSIKLVGITRSDYLNLFDLPMEQRENLNIEFVPTSNSIVRHIIDSDMMIYLAESSQSGESIGIAALEALCLGIPVLIKNKDLTDYSKSPGIFDLNYFIEVFESELDIKNLIKNEMKLGENDVAFWRNESSAKRYNQELEKILNSL